MPIDLPALHARLLEAAPLIQNITNTVVQQFSANVLLAVGAAPAMLDHEADAAQFAALANGLLVNFGTATRQQLLAADAAIRAANARGIPWVLDPVSVGIIDYRTGRIQQAAECHPTVIRGNASEIAALAGTGAGGRGVDAIDAVDDVLPDAITLSQVSGAIVAVSGPQDAIVEVAQDTVRVARVGGGHPFMPKVIGTGCSLGSLVAAYLAAQRDAAGTRLAGDFDAAIAAHAHFKLAGQIAGETARGPGSFAVAFLDALHTIQSADLAQIKVRMEVRELPDACGL